MTTNDDVIEELRAIRTRLDQLAAHFFQAKAADELLPVWDCGHRHRSRAEAAACKKQRAIVGGPIDALVVIGDPGAPPNADAGSFD